MVARCVEASLSELYAQAFNLLAPRDDIFREPNQRFCGDSKKRECVDSGVVQIAGMAAGFFQTQYARIGGFVQR
ncbi:MAG TPA: hypothetical protein VNF46_06015, partial [Gammaproteobacteria bacterium]|nr:hypothetical protein [Gammaproteobacteria bacterium]